MRIPVALLILSLIPQWSYGGSCYSSSFYSYSTPVSYSYSYAPVAKVKEVKVETIAVPVVQYLAVPAYATTYTPPPVQQQPTQYQQQTPQYQQPAQSSCDQRSALLERELQQLRQEMQSLRQQRGGFDGPSPVPDYKPDSPPSQQLPADPGYGPPPSQQLPAPREQHPNLQSSLQGVVSQSCVRCHNDQRQEANLNLSDLSKLGQEELLNCWAEVKCGHMPQGGQRLPDEQVRLFREVALSKEVRNEDFGSRPRRAVATRSER